MNQHYTDAKAVQRATVMVIDALVSLDAYRAAAYLSEKLVVRASRKLYSGRLPAKNQNLEVILTIGRPNYAQRKFIALCKRAGEPFPVKKVQLQYPPRSRA